MCCLKYESPVYEELVKVTPKTGSTVLLPGDPPVRAYVMEANLITGNLRVKPENSDTPITVNRDAVESLTDNSRRMTKEDLRDRKGAPAGGKTIGKPAPKHPAPAQSQNAENKPAQPADQKPRKPKPTKPKPVPKADKPHSERPERPLRPSRPAAPSPAPAAQTADQPSLYTEFGETHHARPAAQPAKPQHTAAPVDMDFTEHRAPHPRTENGDTQNSQKRDFRRPRRPQGQFNRRNNNGNNPSNNTSKPPQNGGENPQS